MTDFLFIAHGGRPPETPEEQARVMAAWGAWMEKHAASLKNPGAPVGKSVTVYPDHVADNGGANPVSGYMIVQADSLEDVIEIAKECPIMEDGSLEIAPIIEM